MRTVFILAASMIALGASAFAAAATSKPFDQEVAAEAHGVVEISNTTGSVDVRGWDRAEVSVHGQIGEGVERVEVKSEPGRTFIKVVLPGHSAHDGEAKLQIQIPKDSELHLTTVSADAHVTGVQGVQRVNVVSGDVRIKGHGQSARLHVSTVSGDVHLEHGAGDLEISSVSGSLVLTLDS